MITRLVVENVRTFPTRTEAEFHPLTLMLGRNDSGKSNLLLPPLMLKQTIESTVDHGPLCLHGTCVSLQCVDQLTWSSSPKNEFTIGVHVDNKTGYEVTFCHNNVDGLSIQQATYKYDGKELQVAAPLTQAMRSAYLDVLARCAPGQDLSLDELASWPRRERCFLLIPLAPHLANHPLYQAPPFKTQIEESVRGIAYLPSQRACSNSCYPIFAITDYNFIGPFTQHIASIIDHWHTTRDERLDVLNAELETLGLPSHPRIRRVNDALAEVIVGKDVTLSQAGQGIAQLLPILVAFLVVQPGQTVIVEHPEGALHPRTIRALAKLIPFVLDRGAQLVFETHSDLFLITIQEQVARGRIRHEDVILHWTLRDEGGATKLFSSMLDTRGDWCDDFPADFEDIRMDVASSYLKATFKI